MLVLTRRLTERILIGWRVEGGEPRWDLDVAVVAASDGVVTLDLTFDAAVPQVPAAVDLGNSPLGPVRVASNVASHGQRVLRVQLVADGHISIGDVALHLPAGGRQVSPGRAQTVKIGVAAPRETTVYRAELADALLAENRAAAGTGGDALAVLGQRRRS